MSRGLCRKVLSNIHESADNSPFASSAASTACPGSVSM
jgi:hypothetical protein